jgi:hypothetical protein
MSRCTRTQGGYVEEGSRWTASPGLLRKCESTPEVPFTGAMPFTAREHFVVHTMNDRNRGSGFGSMVRMQRARARGARRAHMSLTRWRLHCGPWIAEPQASNSKLQQTRGHTHSHTFDTCSGAHAWRECVPRYRWVLRKERVKRSPGPPTAGCMLGYLQCVRVAYTDAQGSRELALQHTTHVANGHACNACATP